MRGRSGRVERSPLSPSWRCNSPQPDDHFIEPVEHVAGRSNRRCTAGSVRRRRPPPARPRHPAGCRPATAADRQHQLRPQPMPAVSATLVNSRSVATSSAPCAVIVCSRAKRCARPVSMKRWPSGPSLASLRKWRRLGRHRRSSPLASGHSRTVAMNWCRPGRAAVPIACRDRRRRSAPGVAAWPVSPAATVTPAILLDTSLVPWLACSTLREISWVAAPALPPPRRWCRKSGSSRR